ncbi:OLC1v1012534C1 [Oldenlandia corymbosa var. corymbosa]|uniref:OLC1v1012534C1 n=1 Tax=Oldenlandia corymbosa var. corymbosa TaxID=529605 RepID=A0AAV1DWU5_OLDCO|nr:OLC1v1012534C1 [Oldenlandia corymbosa var. corymbosa]
MSDSHAEKPNPSTKASSDSSALIDGICKTTIIPPFCLNFLHSDPRFAQSTLKGFAEITVEKAKSNATATTSLISHLLRKTQDSTLKGHLQSCLKNINDAVAQLDKAKSSAVSGGPGDLNNFASASLTEVGGCGDDIGAAEPPKLKKARQNLDNIIRKLNRRFTDFLMEMDNRREIDSLIEEQLHVHGLESPGTQIVSVLLTSKNYLIWRCVMISALEVKMKVGFVEGSFLMPAEDSPILLKWRRENSMIEQIWNQYEELRPTPEIEGEIGDLIVKRENEDKTTVTPMNQGINKIGSIQTCPVGNAGGMIPYGQQGQTQTYNHGNVSITPLDFGSEGTDSYQQMFNSAVQKEVELINKGRGIMNTGAGHSVNMAHYHDFAGSSSYALASWIASDSSRNAWVIDT